MNIKYFLYTSFTVFLLSLPASMSAETTEEVNATAGACETTSQEFILTASKEKLFIFNLNNVVIQKLLQANEKILVHSCAHNLLAFKTKNKIPNGIKVTMREPKVQVGLPPIIP